MNKVNIVSMCSRQRAEEIEERYCKPAAECCK
jgi:hypothetical protein